MKTVQFYTTMVWDPSGQRSVEIVWVPARLLGGTRTRADLQWEGGPRVLAELSSEELQYAIVSILKGSGDPQSAKDCLEGIRRAPKGDEFHGIDSALVQFAQHIVSAPHVPFEESPLVKKAIKDLIETIRKEDLIKAETSVMKTSRWIPRRLRRGGKRDTASPGGGRTAAAGEGTWYTGGREDPTHRPHGLSAGLITLSGSPSIGGPSSGGPWGPA